jgi:hypothetical protein
MNFLQLYKEGAQRILAGRLACLKARAKIWSNEKRIRERLEMVKIEGDLDDLFRLKA